MENNIYDKIRHTDEKSNEYWMVREFATAIGYKDYRNFKGLIEKAQKLCAQNSARFLFSHFFCGKGQTRRQKEVVK